MFNKRSLSFFTLFVVNILSATPPGTPKEDTLLLEQQFKNFDHSDSEYDAEEAGERCQCECRCPQWQWIKVASPYAAAYVVTTVVSYCACVVTGQGDILPLDPSCSWVSSVVGLVGPAFLGGLRCLSDYCE